MAEKHVIGNVEHIFFPMFLCVGDQQYHYRTSSDHLLRLNLSGQTSILDPHARRRLLSAAVRYANLPACFTAHVHCSPELF